MSNFLVDALSVFESAGIENLVCLQKTAKLTGKDDEEWLAEAYRAMKNKAAASRYVVSFCNSVVFQRRLVFILNKRLFGNLMRSDENHTPKNRGFDNSKWKEFFSKLCQNGFIEVVAAGRNGEQICRLTNKDLIQKIAILTALDRMAALYEEQMKQTIDFIENKVPPARVPAHPHQPKELGTRNVVTSNREIAPASSSPVAPSLALDASACRPPSAALKQFEERLQEANAKPKKMSEFISFLEKIPTS